MPDGDETAVAAAEAIDPDLAGPLADVRPLGEWVPRPGLPPSPPDAMSGRSLRPLGSAGSAPPGGCPSAPWSAAGSGLGLDP